MTTTKLKKLTEYYSDQESIADCAGDREKSHEFGMRRVLSEIAYQLAVMNEPVLTLGIPPKSGSRKKKVHREA